MIPLRISDFGGHLTCGQKLWLVHNQHSPSAPLHPCVNPERRRTELGCEMFRIDACLIQATSRNLYACVDSICFQHIQNQGKAGYHGQEVNSQDTFIQTFSKPTQADGDGPASYQSKGHLPSHGPDCRMGTVEVSVRLRRLRNQFGLSSAYP